jgi:hypothetical protein
MLNTRHLMHKRPLPVRGYGRQVARRLRGNPFADWAEPRRVAPHTYRRWRHRWVTLSFAAGSVTGVALAHTLITHP